MQYKRRIILLYAIVAFGLAISAISFGQTHFNEWDGLIFGVMIMVVAIPFHFLGRINQVSYFISFIMNSIAVGFSISTYYIFRDLAPSLEEMIFAAFIGLIILIFFSLISITKTFMKSPKTYSGILISIMFTISLLLWIDNNDIIYSTLFYFLNITYFYMIGMIIANHIVKDLNREMSIISFGAFIIISIIVLIIVSEGEALGGLDAIHPVGGKNKKQNT